MPYLPIGLAEENALDLVVIIVNIVSAEFSGRWLPPHKIRPLLGVH